MGLGFFFSPSFFIFKANQNVLLPSFPLPLHRLGAVVGLVWVAGSHTRERGHPVVLVWCGQAGGCPGDASLLICQPGAVHPPHPAPVLGPHCLSAEPF